MMNRKDILIDIFNTAIRKVDTHWSVYKFAEWLDESGFFLAPASISYHGNTEGGLFDHSYSVMEQLVGLTQRNSLIWTRPESPYIVGLFHDLCKMDDYMVEVDDPGKELFGGNVVGRTYTFKRNPAPILTGHGDKSVLMLAPWMELTEEEVMCIRWHMGAFDDRDNWNRYGLAVERWPNVLWTHHADMIAARILKC